MMSNDDNIKHEGEFVFCVEEGNVLEYLAAHFLSDCGIKAEGVNITGCLTTSKERLMISQYCSVYVI